MTLEVGSSIVWRPIKRKSHEGRDRRTGDNTTQKITRLPRFLCESSQPRDTCRGLTSDGDTEGGGRNLSVVYHSQREWEGRCVADRMRKMLVKARSNPVNGGSPLVAFVSYFLLLVQQYKLASSIRNKTMLVIAGCVKVFQIKEDKAPKTLFLGTLHSSTRHC